MSEQTLIFRVHAILRMFQWGISDEDVRQALAAGETIETYGDDEPYPSRLILGWTGSIPIHVVAAFNPICNITYVITVYRPDARRWDDYFRRRTS
ncbi:MAG: DUF4258 domain-containing protein [Chloroflexi bacterium]|nr:DUF4258 domain-containing protein [Chloroflexota bacterium]